MQADHAARWAGLPAAGGAITWRRAGSLQLVAGGTERHRAAQRRSRHRALAPQYDLSATTYSPDGKVFQTDYAQKAVDNSRCESNS